jgi:hypothetical protein
MDDDTFTVFALAVSILFAVFFVVMVMLAIYG